MRSISLGLVVACFSVPLANAQALMQKFTDDCVKELLAKNVPAAQMGDQENICIKAKLRTTTNYQECLDRFDKLAAPKPQYSTFIDGCVKEKVVAAPRIGETVQAATPQATRTSNSGSAAGFAKCKKGLMEQGLSIELSQQKCLSEFQIPVGPVLSSTAGYDFYGAFEADLTNKSSDAIVTGYTVSVIFPNQPDKFERATRATWLEPNAREHFALPAGDRWQKYLRARQPPNNPFNVFIVDVMGLKISQ